MTLAVVVMLGAVVITQVVPRMTQGQAAILARTLGSITDALHAYRGDLGRYPYKLSYLSAPPTGTVRDACNQTVSDVSQWKGPYVDRTFPATGLTVARALVRDTIVRSPATIPVSGVKFATVSVQVRNVDQGVATEIENAFDGNANFTNGAIRWTAGAAGQGTLELVVPIRGC